MPKLEYPHLLDWLMEVGPCEFTQSGIKPVSFQEIKAWSDVSGLVLVENEPQIIKQMSGEYCGMYIKGRDRNCPPPYIPENTDDAIAKIRAHTSDQMRKLMKRA